jgi:hypothetical protein
MVGLVVLLLCWECGLQVMLPPSMTDRPPKDAARQEFVEDWLEQRMAKETAERLEQARQAIAELEPTTARDAERQAFVKRWMELRSHECWRMRRRHHDLLSSASCGWLADTGHVEDRREAGDLMPYRRVHAIRVQGGGGSFEPDHFVPADPN